MYLPYRVSKVDAKWVWALSLPSLEPKLVDFLSKLLPAKKTMKLKWFNKNLKFIIHVLNRFFYQCDSFLSWTSISQTPWVLFIDLSWFFVFFTVHVIFWIFVLSQNIFHFCIFEVILWILKVFSCYGDNTVCL